MASSARANALPLFYQAPRVLDAKRHAKAGVAPNEGYRFAQSTNSIPLNGIEFLEAAKHYPIVFVGEDAVMPAAVVGLEKSNYFVQDDGSWLAGHYIPAYARQYPFIFMEQAGSDRFYLCIDEQARSFSAKAKSGAEPLFDAKGNAAAISQHALEFCTAFYQHHAITKNFCADLVTHKLLMQAQSQAKLRDGKTLNLSGFRTIDRDAFRALPDSVFLDFRSKGWLPFIYFAVAAAENWKRLAPIYR